MRRGLGGTIMILAALGAANPAFAHDPESAGRFPGGVPWPVVATVGVAVVALLLLASNRMLNREVRQRATALRQSEERFRLLFETAGDAIFLMDGRHFVDCNARTLEIFGCTRGQIVGETPLAYSPEMQPDGADSAASARLRIEAALRGEPQFFEWQHTRRDGSPFDAEVTLTRLVTGGERFIQAIVRDVTERKRLEADLRQAQKMEAIGTLAGGIAHDFNNILSAILGYGELARLETGEGDAELRQHLDQVVLAGERARDLVAQILAFSRRSVENRHPVDPGAAIGEALRLLRSTIPANIQLRQDLAPCGPVVADPTGIHQILMNLCTNSYQAIGDREGEIDVILRERERADDDGGDGPAAGRYAVIEVADSGPGMSEDVARKVFEPYFTTKGTDRGTGLGMAVVHGIVDDHGGHIDLETAPGEGTRVRVWLPLAAAPAADPAEQGERREGAAGEEHVLLLDDEPEIVRAISLGLRAQGFRVTGFDEPEAALAAFGADPGSFDVVITDMTMPGMSGAEFAQGVLEIRPGLPIILCTGYSETITRESALDGGVSSFVMKPVLPSRLGAEVRAVLDGIPA